MHPRSFRLLARVAGSALLVIAAPPPAHAIEAEGLPPRITTVTQTVRQVEVGSASRLGLQAVDPQGSPLTFSWSATAGTLSMPLGNASTSRLTWTAPLCMASGSPPVTATVTNGLGLSTTTAFDFSFVQHLEANRQPPFTADGFEQFENVTLRQGQLSLPPWGPLDAEHIVFPEDLSLSVAFVHKDSLASHALGYLYVDELQQRGYVDARGHLLDFNANGIADLHEDLYNLAPPSGPQARPYIGVNRRCLPTFVSQGLTYSQPELALNAGCAPSFASQSLPDARPGSHGSMTIDVIGRDATTSPPPGTGFSDNGLFARIPNLLEPAHPLNSHRGLGHLVFLLTDDDEESTTPRQMGAVADVDSSYPDGIPDYDVSAYDARGVRRTTNPDPGITPADRKVDLGLIQGGRELVFFLVVNLEAQHAPDTSVVLPCLRKAPDGRCTLHLKAPLSVFFSKTEWNLDQDPVGHPRGMAFNVGCGSNDLCTQELAYRHGCLLASGQRKLCGWLYESALETLASPDYGHTLLLKDAAELPLSGNGNMPHVLLHSPVLAPGRWLLAFEDFNGGGDRDFNDVVFQLQALTEPGRVRSRSLSPAWVSSPEEEGCVLSRVRFRKSDGAQPDCDGPSTSITYAVATDCGTCNAGVCQTHPAPTWHPLTLPPGPAETLVDVSDTPGTHLCWKAELPGVSGRCTPVIGSVDVGYEYAPVGP
ncbi:MAG: DUF4114 domain-containing protein [Myxococcaceae bacterium]|nr:MAG: DUF4114 domain-containing protein [Myxococcaceae bacterium]